MSARVDKQRLRELLKQRLSSGDPEDRRAAAEAIAATVLALPELRAARSVFTCLSFGDELDTWALADRLVAAGKRVVVPRTTAGDPDLHVHPYPCAMRTLSFGLRQPKRTAPEIRPPEIDAAIDVALILGLGFDARGYRLGYGAGYFDRFLAGRTFPTIGLALDGQIVDRVPEEPHDIPLTMVVSEARLLRRP